MLGAREGRGLVRTACALARGTKREGRSRLSQHAGTKARGNFCAAASPMDVAERECEREHGEQSRGWQGWISSEGARRGRIETVAQRRGEAVRGWLGTAGRGLASCTVQLYNCTADSETASARVPEAAAAHWHCQRAAVGTPDLPSARPPRRRPAHKTDTRLGLASAGNKLWGASFPATARRDAAAATLFPRLVPLDALLRPGGCEAEDAVPAWPRWRRTTTRTPPQPVRPSGAWRACSRGWWGRAGEWGRGRQRVQWVQWVGSRRAAGGQQVSGSRPEMALMPAMID